MNDKPNLVSVNYVPSLNVQEYERYNPTAFNDSLTILEKINKMIYQLNNLGAISNDLVKQWNELIQWILSNGLEEIVNKVIDEKIADGTFNDLFNSILGDLVNLETVDKTNIVNAINEVNKIAVECQKNIGNMDDLLTDDKTDLVGAINEIKKQEILNNLAPIMIAEATGHGVISGFKVTQQSILSMGVNIGNNTEENIVHMINGNRYKLNSLSLPVDDANPLYTRIDIVYVSKDGVITYESGTANTSAVAPVTPLGGELLAYITVVPNDTTINNVDITDKRELKGLKYLNTTKKSNFVEVVNEILKTIQEKFNESIENADNLVGDLVDLETFFKGNVVGAINEVIKNVGGLDLLDTTEKQSIVLAINELVLKISELTTEFNTELVEAVEKIETDIGDITTLKTIFKTNLVGAINEVFVSASLALRKIGDLDLLNTTSKIDVVSAINEVIEISEDAIDTLKVLIGDMSLLETTDKSSLVKAINEVNNKISVDLEEMFEKIEKQFNDNMQYVSIKKYGNNLKLALQSEMMVSIPEGDFECEPLTRLLLAGKKIRGSGKRTHLIFRGDVTCFDAVSIQDFFLEDLSVMVETTNTKEVVRISGASATGESLKNRIRNVWMETINYTQGKFTGVRLISNVAGVYQNDVLDVSVENCHNGILIEGEGTLAWATHNLIQNPYIKKFTGIALGFIERGGTSVINNTIANPRVVDWTQEDIERTALRISGMANSVTNFQLFNDGHYGTMVAIDLSEKDIRSYNNTITGGGIEGRIKGEENINNHNIDINFVKRKNWDEMMNRDGIPITYIKSQVNNLLLDYNFENGKGAWEDQGILSEVKAPIFPAHFSKVMLVTKNVGGPSKISINLPKPELYAGNYVTFTASVKSSAPVFTVIDEGAAGYQRGTYHTGSNKFELLSVSKKIAVGAVVQIGLALEIDAPVGTTFEIDWVNVNYGRMMPTVPIQPTLNYVYKNSGTAVVPAGANHVIVQHGLEVTPQPKDVVVTPANNLGEATKFWTEYVSANQFYIYVDKDPAGEGAKFNWKVEI